MKQVGEVRGDGTAWLYGRYSPGTALFAVGDELDAVPHAPRKIIVVEDDLPENWAGLVFAVVVFVIVVGWIAMWWLL